MNVQNRQFGVQNCTLVCFLLRISSIPTHCPFVCLYVCLLLSFLIFHLFAGEHRGGGRERQRARLPAAPPHPQHPGERPQGSDC